MQVVYRKYLDTGPKPDRTRPVLSATDPRSVSRHVLGWFLGILGVIFAPLINVYLLLSFGNVKDFEIPLGVFRLNGIATGALGIYVYMLILFLVWAQKLFPNYFLLHQVRPFHQFRYHRSHISHMRQDRFKRIVNGQLFTVFVQGIHGKTVSILVTPHTTVSQIKTQLIHRHHVPEGFWSDTRFRTSLSIPMCFKPILDSDTVQSLSVRTMSHFRIRVSLLGGVQDDSRQSDAGSSSGSGKRKAEDTSVQVDAADKRRKRNTDEVDPSMILKHPRERKTNKLHAAINFQNQPNNIDDRDTATSAVASGSKLPKRRPPPRRKQPSASATPITSSPPINANLIQSVIAEIADLSSCLPESVPIGQPDGKIATSLNEEAESPWQSFNSFFDRVFGADTVDPTTGRLKFVSRGPHGMDFVNRYLQTVSQQHLSELPLELVHMRLVRVRDELDFLVGVTQENTKLVGENEDGAARKTKLIREKVDKAYRPPAKPRAHSVDDIPDVLFDEAGNEIILGDTEDETSELEWEDTERNSKKGKGKESELQAKSKSKSTKVVISFFKQKLMHVKNDPVLASFSEAIDAGIRKLDKYHQLAKSNQFYVVATVCHPSFQLNWFGKRSSTDYQRAKILFEHVYESYVATAPAGPNGTSPVKSKKSTASDDLVQSLVDDIVSDSDDGLPMSQDRAASELERYLSGEGGRGDSMKPLDWWKKHAKITEDTRGFLIISRIARDFLAIPGTSVSVERLFSSSRHLCSDLRSSMKAETTTLAMCAKVWLKSGLFEFDSRKLISGRKRVEEKPVSN
ncbi:hypothetical protein D9758_006529 [Tetrapyrgos nigripes]|uniref:HAT C-terminal dimerisation domain-containing protein n=1 Tax=Tetrapyrgos nigripes TaxID=182062 RepID=A0A8H5GKS6_9AGAR|nr:hypothetical protein D9758_006529 [Tetrapyrgos nigripes]